MFLLWSNTPNFANQIHLWKHPIFFLLTIKSLVFVTKPITSFKNAYLSLIASFFGSYMGDPWLNLVNLYLLDHMVLISFPVVYPVLFMNPQKIHHRFLTFVLNSIVQVYFIPRFCSKGETKISIQYYPIVMPFLLFLSGTNCLYCVDYSCLFQGFPSGYSSKPLSY